MTPEYLEELADWVDPDKMWRVSPPKRDTLTEEQRRQCNAGIALRRHAMLRRELLALLEQKRSLLITPLMSNCDAKKSVDTPPDHERQRPEKRA